MYFHDIFNIIQFVLFKGAKYNNKPNITKMTNNKRKTVDLESCTDVPITVHQATQRHFWIFQFKI